MGLCEINGIMYAMRPLRNFKTNQCCYLTPLAKSATSRLQEARRIAICPASSTGFCARERR